MATSFFASHLARVPVVAILRGLDVDTTVRLARACWDAGIELVEVPTQGPRGLRALETVAREATSHGGSIGAGTVYTVADATRAREAGAGFLVAPGLDDATVEYAASHEIPYLPGVTTPSEVQRAVALGLRILKLFPAGPLGPTWLSAMHGPFPDVEFVAVGGVSPDNAQQFLDAGALGVGVGGALGSSEAAQALANLRRRKIDTRPLP